jgi:hypothetical protein
MGGKKEKTVRISVVLEKGALELPREGSKDYAKKLNRRRSVSAAVKVAGTFFQD